MISTQSTWKQAWERLSPGDFEEMVFWILNREGFHNVTWFGANGSDKGRDITCERMEVFGPRISVCRCLVQCKKYGGRVSRNLLYEELVKSTEHHPDYYILATSGILGASTKDWIVSQHVNFPFKVITWERVDVQVLLERHQDLMARFLGLPIDDQRVIRQLGSQFPGLAHLDDILMDSAARAAITTAIENAVGDMRAATLADLIVACLRRDSYFVRPTFESAGINPDDLATEIESSVVSRQPKREISRFGIPTTPSFRAALESALRLTRALGRPLLTCETLLHAIWFQKKSPTMEFIRTRFGLDADAPLPFVKRDGAVPPNKYASSKYIYMSDEEIDPIAALEALVSSSDQTVLNPEEDGDITQI